MTLRVSRENEISLTAGAASRAALTRAAGDSVLRTEVRLGSPDLLVSLPFGSQYFRYSRRDSAPPAKNAPASKPALVEKQFKTKDGKTLPSMDELSKLAGDPKAGGAIFRNTQGANCIKCHQIADEGQMIGPPLTVIGGKLSKPQLYESILYPSAAIEMGYEAWIVKTKKGEVFAGLKVEDTPDRITIKDTDGKYHDVDRDQIDKLVMQKVSLMPEGLNETMTQQDLVNLVEYLTSLKN